ncbi:TIGR02147 family protein, partial [Fibrobacter sp.]
MNPYIDIFQFTHFRKFLEEYQAARAKVEPSFTRTEICALLGLEKSRSYFADVLRGKKVSPRMVQKFIEILQLDRKEAKYFETLVALDQAKTDAIRNAMIQELLKQHPNPQHIVNEDAYEYYSRWYNSALFAILDAMDVTDDMTPVQKRIFPKVPLGKLKDSLALL